MAPAFLACKTAAQWNALLQGICRSTADFTPDHALRPDATNNRLTDDIGGAHLVYYDGGTGEAAIEPGPYFDERSPFGKQARIEVGTRLYKAANNSDYDLATGAHIFMVCGAYDENAAGAFQISKLDDGLSAKGWGWTGNADGTIGALYQGATVNQNVDVPAHATDCSDGRVRVMFGGRSLAGLGEMLTYVPRESAIGRQTALGDTCHNTDAPMLLGTSSGGTGYYSNCGQRVQRVVTWSGTAAENVYANITTIGPALQKMLGDAVIVTPKVEVSVVVDPSSVGLDFGRFGAIARHASDGRTWKRYGAGTKMWRLLDQDPVDPLWLGDGSVAAQAGVALRDMWLDTLVVSATLKDGVGSDDLVSGGSPTYDFVVEDRVGVYYDTAADLHSKAYAGPGTSSYLMFGEGSIISEGASVNGFFGFFNSSAVGAGFYFSGGSLFGHVEDASGHSAVTPIPGSSIMSTYRNRRFFFMLQHDQAAKRIRGGLYRRGVAIGEFDISSAALTDTMSAASQVLFCGGINIGGILGGGWTRGWGFGVGVTAEGTQAYGDMLRAYGQRLG